MVAFVGLEAAVTRRTDTIPVLVVLSLVGFVGSVTIARFAWREPAGEGKVRTLAEIALEEASRADADRAANAPDDDDGEHRDGFAPGMR
jgi:multicomponent Na+:H+ antiporter subunit F